MEIKDMNPPKPNNEEKAPEGLLVVAEAEVLKK